jgi:phosphoribosylformimino-5-aminoimidazole carboxamide ribotide isomerase
VRIIPVLDVKGDVVVHAVAGRYWPVRSRLTDSTALPDIAEAMLAACGSDELYIADLDAIRYGIPSQVYRDYLERGRRATLLDAGGLGPEFPHVRPVLALELGYTQEQALEFVRTDRSSAGQAFSIDLIDGRLHDGWRKWDLPNDSAVLGLARQVYELGFRTLIVLDLAKVGTGGGPVTAEVCAAVREALPAVELITGGGVRNWDDVKRLEDAGTDAVLVASALHDGTLLR